MSSGEDGRAMSSVTSSDGAGDGADDDRRSHDDKRSSSELPPSASTPTTTAAAAPAGPNPTTVHLTTLGAWSATDSMMGSMPAAAAAAAESTSERDDTDAATIDAVLPGEAVAAVADHVVVSFEGRRPGGGRDAGQSSLPATVVAAGSVEPAPSSPTGQNHGAGGRATSGVSSALKSSPRFSPLAVQLNTIRKVAGRAVSRGGGAGGGAAAGSFSSADRFEAGADSERGANSESDASASASNRTPSFIGGLGMLSGGAATVVSALQKMGSSADNSESGGGTDQQVPSSISARLNVLLLATSSKRSVPPAVRAERAARVQRAVQSSTDSNGEPLADPFPTQLHRVCANPDASLLHLQTELARTPSSASVTDCLGRLPLHVLGDNTGLVSSAVGRATATKFAHQLMRVYPEAITASDAAGFYPFVGLIYDWEQHSYRHADKKQRTGASTMLQPATRLFGRITDVVSQTGTGISNAMEKSYQAAASFVTDPAAGESSARDGISAGAGPGSFSFRNLFPRIAIWDEVEWCFEMLSIEMEELGGKSGGLYPSENDATSEDLNERDLDARLLLAKHLLTKMPSIIKTILLIDSGGDEGTTRKVLLQSPLFRAMLLQKESVGDWLTAMIRKRGMASQFAVDYLSMVSGTTIEDYVGLFRPVLLVDKEEFQYARTAVFQAIDELDGTVASLVTLGEKEIERAVTTTVIWCKNDLKLLPSYKKSGILTMFHFQISCPGTWPDLSSFP